MERRDDFHIPEEVAEWIGLKKSEYLSRLIQKQDPEDIGFEDFHLFDSFIPGTIERPDKTLSFIEDKQKMRTYIRTYHEKSGFHQLVIGVLLEDKDKTANVFVPVITFVTKKNEMVKEFSVGEVIDRHTLN